ncbi:MAG TPA: PP2C family protein-serine/threonine phosphatase, partial [Thermoanaerobaculia bacterium]|nr:PP2C family protein-serine/threonine phosphatase [Thermoanaerobaculia bacterium]
GTLIALAVKIIVGLVIQAGGAVLMLSGSDYGRWMAAAQVIDVFATLTYVLIPVSFAIAILKYRLMNIDVIIRKTVVYAILSGAIIVVYLGLVGGLGTVLVNVAGVKNQTMVIASTLVVALLFVPLRNKLQTLVDRNLFRHKYDYPEALKAISAETLTANDLGEFLTSVAEKTQQALQNRSVTAFISRHDEFVAAAKVGVADSLVGTLRTPRASLLPMLHQPFVPAEHPLPDDAAAALARIEAVLVMPVNTPGTPPNGFLALGAKLSNAQFDAEDVDFLRLVATQTDIGVDRIRQQREEADYEQARAIQQTLLPREMPRVAGLELSGTWLPARTMGGDYYDLLELGPNELAVCIGDVAGKGMPAALLMSGLQAAVRASASGSPRDLCERVRRVVVSSLSGGRFVTFFYATLDTAAMRLRWCNAGHNAPVLARADGSVTRLSGGGPAFSRLFRDDRYQEHEMALLPGDRLVLFTDGVSEASGGNGEMFGEPLIEALVVENRTLGARELQQSIVEAATTFSGGELDDDLTLVVVAVM